MMDCEFDACSDVIDIYRQLRARIRLISRLDHSQLSLRARVELRHTQRCVDAMAWCMSQGSALEPLRLVFSHLKDNTIADIEEFRSAKSWLTDHLGLEMPPPAYQGELVQQLLELLKCNAESARVAGYAYRCSEQLRDHPDWYLIFDTLTLSPTIADRDDPYAYLCGEPWKRYRRNFENRIATACGGSVRGAKKKFASKLDYVAHVAILEGIEEGNPHCHCLWFCRDVPTDWKKDPNVGLPVPLRREIDAAKGQDIWPYGWNCPKAIRLDASDAWARAGFKWPVDRNGKPLHSGGAGGVVGYLLKYMTKSRKESQGKWRVRISPKLGMRRLKAAIQQCPQHLLRALSQPASMSAVIPDHLKVGLPPRTLIAYVSRDERYSRLLRKAPKRIMRRTARPMMPSYNLLDDLGALIGMISSGELNVSTMLSKLEIRAVGVRRAGAAFEWLMDMMYIEPDFRHRGSVHSEPL